MTRSKFPTGEMPEEDKPNEILRRIHSDERDDNIFRRKLLLCNLHLPFFELCYSCSPEVQIRCIRGLCRFPEKSRAIDGQAHRRTSDRWRRGVHKYFYIINKRLPLWILNIFLLILNANQQNLYGFFKLDGKEVRNFVLPLYSKIITKSCTLLPICVRGHIPAYVKNDEPVYDFVG